MLKLAWSPALVATVAVFSFISESLSSISAFLIKSSEFLLSLLILFGSYEARWLTVAIILQNHVRTKLPKFGRRSPAAWTSMSAKRFFVRAQITPNTIPLTARTTIE